MGRLHENSRNYDSRKGQRLSYLTYDARPYDHRKGVLHETTYDYRTYDSRKSHLREPQTKIP